MKSNIRMKVSSGLVLLFLVAWGLFPGFIKGKEGKPPIVLTHGFLGWGRDEMLGYKYWGGNLFDIQEFLKGKGFPVYTASVGPISSNHDRACELFYQIKGGTVDYGLEHSSHYGHKRFGKKYKGFYRQWDKEHPVFLVGHSMGGQTVRLLVELLARDFFHAGSDETWVKGIVSITTPHNGTTLATMINTYSNGYAEEILAKFIGLSNGDKKFYDFDLQQWNISPQDDEGLSEYLKRIDETIGDSKDLSMYDLLPKGARELNNKIRNFKTVYYFSYGAEDTYVLNKRTGYHWPRVTMSSIFWSGSHYMGRYTGKEVEPSRVWWPNDGVVNSCSMKGPHNGTIVTYVQGKVPRRGVWNYMGTIHNKDHARVIGHFETPSSGKWLKKFYLDLATMLSNLP